MACILGMADGVSFTEETTLILTQLPSLLEVVRKAIAAVGSRARLET